jgi:hypothetical protein
MDLFEQTKKEENPFKNYKTLKYRNGTVCESNWKLIGEF